MGIDTKKKTKIKNKNSENTLYIFNPMLQLDNILYCICYTKCNK